MAISPIELNPAITRTDNRDVARRERDDRPTQKDTSVAATDPESVASAVAANRAITLDDRSIEFSYDDQLDRVIVKVRSKDTDEVVRQIPPKDYLQFLSRFKEAVGVLFDEVA